MNKELWETWISNWKWIIAIANRRGWNVRDELKIKEPVSLDIITKLENAHQIILPVEFIEVLTNYSSGASFK